MNIIDDTLLYWHVFCFECQLKGAEIELVLSSRLAQHFGTEARAICLDYLIIEESPKQRILAVACQAQWLNYQQKHNVSRSILAMSQSLEQKSQGWHYYQSTDSPLSWHVKDQRIVDFAQDRVNEPYITIAPTDRETYKPCLNLSPWRERHRRKKARFFTCAFILWCGLCFTLGLGLYHFQHTDYQTHKATLIKNQQKLATIKNDITTLNQANHYTQLKKRILTLNKISQQQLSWHHMFAPIKAPIMLNQFDWSNNKWKMQLQAPQLSDIKALQQHLPKNQLTKLQQHRHYDSAYLKEAS